MNKSGEALQSFCAVNELVIMNTTFEKRNIHKYTLEAESGIVLIMSS